MAKPGRPAYKITEEVIKQVESLASQGLTLAQIAQVLGITYKTLNEKSKQFSELSDAIKRGQAKGIATIANALFQNAKAGNTVAQIFYLKNRASGEWKDKQDHELTGKDGAALNPPQIVVITSAEES